MPCVELLAYDKRHLSGWLPFGCQLVAVCNERIRILSRFIERQAISYRIELEQLVVHLRSR